MGNEPVIGCTAKKKKKRLEKNQEQTEKTLPAVGCVAWTCLFYITRALCYLRLGQGDRPKDCCGLNKLSLMQASFSLVIHTLCVILSVSTLTANVEGCNELCEADASLTFGSFCSLMCIPLWPDKALFSTA